MSQLKVNSIIPVGGVPSGGAGGIIQCVQTFKVDGTSQAGGGTTTFYDISGNTININDLEIAKLNLSIYGGFYIEYKKVIIKNFTILLFAFLLVINSQNINNFFTTLRFRFLSLFFFIFLFVFSFFRGGFGTQGLPSQLQVLVPFPFLFMTSNYEIIYDNIEIKEEIQNKLVLIIDESISYKYFQKALKVSD